MKFLHRALHWLNVEESLDIFYQRGVFKPSDWVVQWYWPEFVKWAQKFEVPTKEQAEGKKKARYDRDPKTGQFPWSQWLLVSPRFDLWCMVEEMLYGEIVTDIYKEYKEQLNKRR